MTAAQVTARTCPHYPACPGCPLVGERYEQQLARKHRNVERTLAAALPPDARVPVAPVVGAARIEGYRTQAKLVARNTRHGLILGLYQRESHHVVDASGCPLHAPAIRRGVRVLREVLERERVPIHGRDRLGVRYVLLRTSSVDRGLLTTIVTSHPKLARDVELAAILRRRLALAGLSVNHNPSPGNEILGPRTDLVWGARTLTERYGDVMLTAGPTAFVQTNPVMAGRIYRTIASTARVKPTDRVLDLYAGVGGIALTLGGRASSVVGIEEVDAAVHAARGNSRRNQARNVSFETASVDEAIEHITPGAIDVVTMNPPRKGCGERVARALGALAPRRLVYLSCSPASFARDARTLHAAGYALQRLTPFDLYPQTDHVELLGIFEPSA